MPEKIINLDIDTKTGDFDLKLDGFKGKGCKDIAKLFEKMGKVKSETIQPSYYEPSGDATVTTGH